MRGAVEAYQVLVQGVGAGGTYDDLEGDPVEVGELLTVEVMTVEDETNAPTHIRIGIGGRGEIHWLFHQASPSAGVVYRYGDPVTLSEGEFPVARFTGATASDVLNFVVRGLQRQQREG